MTRADGSANAADILGSGIDAIAVKPARSDVAAAAELPFETVVVDYEGRSHFPDRATLTELADGVDDLRITVAVRGDGFDPFGDDSWYRELPDDAGLVLVAGNPAYLSPDERRRPVADRLEAVVQRSRDPWVGTEGIERTALATGATQFLLLSPTTERDCRGLRVSGFDGGVVVYAPTVLTDDTDEVLDAIGPYAGRRRHVRETLPKSSPTDSDATGRTRAILADACERYALVGRAGAVRARVESLRAAGVDRIVSYPARGLEALDGEG